MRVDRSLGGTIAFGFASLLAIMAVVIGFAVREVNATQWQGQLLMDELLPAADAAQRLALNAVRFDDALQAFVTTRAPDDLRAARLSGRSVRRAADDLQRVRLSDRQDEYLSAQVKTAAGDFLRQAPMAEELAITAPPASAAVFVHQYVKGAVADFSGAAEHLASRVDAQVWATRAEISLREQRLTRALILAFALAGVMGVLFSLFCLRLVTEPVGRLVLAARAMETGDYSLARDLGVQESGEPRQAPQNELAMLARTFAHVAVSLEEREQRLRLQTTYLAAANAQLTALQSLTDAALADLPLDQLLEQLLRRVVAGTGGDSGAIYLTDPASGRLEARAAVNLEEAGKREATISVAAELVASAAAEAVLHGDDLAAQPDPASRMLRQAGVKSYLAVPIQVGGQGVGLAYVDFRQPQAFDPPALNLMRVCGERVAWAIERVRTLAALESWGHELERRLDQQRAQLLRSERLAAIGLVGGSIAHELRNPLGVINNAVYFLRRRSTDFDAKMQRHLEIIEREVLHSRRIINGLVDYSDGIEPVSRRLNINTLIRTALEDSTLPETVTVALALDENLPLVVGDESQLLQVFEHLIRNAVQAMEGKGALKIANGASEAWVWTSIQDTGPGVALEDQARIFEPLVSTRVKGMGLGLSLVRKILQAHGGEVRLASEPGSGAAFTMELPITDRLRSPSMTGQVDLSSRG